MNKWFIFPLSILILLGCESKKTSTYGKTAFDHGLQREIHEEESSPAYHQVKTILSQAIKFRETDPEKAIELIEEAVIKVKRSKLKSYSLKADVHNAKGTILERKHQYEKAINEYDQALHLYDSALILASSLEKKKGLISKIATTQVNNGIVEMRRNDYYHAKINFDQVISRRELSPEQRSYAMQMKASALRKEITHTKPHDFEFDGIWDCYEAAWHLNIDQHAISKNMGDFLSEQGAYEKANEMYNQVAALMDHEQPREKKNEEGDLHFRKCKNIITNFDLHKDEKLLSETLDQLEEDAHNKYYDTDYLQADIEYLMALGYYYLGRLKVSRKHLESSIVQNAKHSNAVARNALLASRLNKKQSINELYKHAALSNDYWKFKIEKRLVEILEKKGKSSEAKDIKENLKEEHQIDVDDIGSKHPEQVLASWQRVKKNKTYLSLIK